MSLDQRLRWVCSGNLAADAAAEGRTQPNRALRETSGERERPHRQRATARRAFKEITAAIYVTTRPPHSGAVHVDPLGPARNDCSLESVGVNQELGGPIQIFVLPVGPPYRE